MPEASPLFKVVEEVPDAPSQQQQAVATKMIYMALAALGQRFVVALSALFTLVTCSSVFVLYFWTPNPTPNQLIMLGGYSIFTLLINSLVIRSRK
jgi:hypothetical protein